MTSVFLKTKRKGLLMGAPPPSLPEVRIATLERKVA